MQIIFSLNKEAFSVDELKHHFADWEYEDEDVFKLIQQLPDTDGMGFIDIYSMICLGILWCAGDIVQKAKAFYQVVKNPGSGDLISFEPDEWEQIIPKMIFISTVFTYDQLEAFESLRVDYDATLIQLAIPILQNSADEGLIPNIFGENEDEIISKQKFIEILTNTDSKWILDPKSIRAKVNSLLDE